ncbi:MAG: alpha-L-rhamnosidase C-terminal domain-containing protein [Victivallaceae bacterium]
MRNQILAGSPAHQCSGFAIIDPLYCPDRMMPLPDMRNNAAPWLYGDGELECRRLQQLRRRTIEAKLKVGYPGEFHQPAEHVRFRHPVVGADIIILRACGAVTTRIGSQEIYRAEDQTQSHKITLPAGFSTPVYLHMELIAADGLPALLIEDGPYSTAGGGWEWSNDGIAWEFPVTFSQTVSGFPPHCSEPAETVLSPAGRDSELFDFGRELFGTVTVRCINKPEIAAGESPAEARNTVAEDCEQPVTVIASGNGEWRSEHPLAFRYLRVGGGAKAEDIACRAPFYPVRYRGAFACSDKQLTRIWMNSAYTLRLCMQDFILDGIKRDRLPWVGDLTMSMMVDAYVFGDAEIVRRSLTALGRAGIGHKHLNGIIDYSLWWIIAHDCFQRYFGDMVYLRREWPRIEAMLACLESRCDADGLLITSAEDWLFIDWVEGDKLTALQMLWRWAQDSAARLAERLGENACAAKWRDRAERLAVILHDRAWDAQHDFWRGIPDKSSLTPSRHAHFISVVSGLARPGQMAAIRNVLLGNIARPVGTPYMAGFENIALSKLGAVDEMTVRVNRYWGGMLERGATTFWEAYDPEQQGDAAYSFYARPFGKSLCHAWSAGPAAFLPMGILGLEPGTDGWKRFSVAPNLGTLTWAAATVPTPQGEIEVLVEDGIMSLRVPSGAVAEWHGRDFTGEVSIRYLTES